MDHEDVLEELNLTVVSHQMEMRAVFQTEDDPLDDKEGLLLRHLGHEPMHIDEIRRLARLPISEVSSALAMMELKGVIAQVGNMNYVVVWEAVASYGND